MKKLPSNPFRQEALLGQSANSLGENIKLNLTSEYSPEILKKKNKAGGIAFPDFRHTPELQESKQHGTGTQTDMWLSGAGERAEEETYTPTTS